MGCLCSKPADQSAKPLIDNEHVPASPGPRYKQDGYDPYANGEAEYPSGVRVNGGDSDGDDEQLVATLDEDETNANAGEIDQKKSLKALKTHKKGTRRYLLHQKIREIFEAKKTRLHEVVQLPPGVDRNEWIAVHVIDFYNDISLLYGTVATVCTHETCPNMSAGTHRYLWADGVTFRTPVKVPAKEYVHYLMNWVDDQLSDESLFPTQEDAVFPEAFLPACKNIFRRLFRVYAHLYHHHFKQFAQLNLQQHLNVCFKRFIYFVLEFNMVKPKELEPLSRLITKIKEMAKAPHLEHK